MGLYIITTFRFYCDACNLSLTRTESSTPAGWHEINGEHGISHVCNDCLATQGLEAEDKLLNSL